MRQPIHLTVPFPRKGLNVNYAVWQQPDMTTIDCLNVRDFDFSSGRLRGGQREGLSKYNTSQISGTNRIQDINYITTIQTGAAAQTAMNIRTIEGCAVSDGDVAKFTSSAVTAATGGTNALSATAPVIFSAELFGILYFADGVNEKQWTASTNTVATWTASAGSLPDGGGGEKPRLIELWRGRIVLSGIENDPHNWFMSAVGDATDFDYAPDPEVVTQASSGNNTTTVGKVGDKINCMIPYSDEILIFGCDHSIYQMTGDPQDGGQIDLLTDSTGMAWGRPWCKDPHGIIYFFGSRGGVYKMVPGAPPTRLTVNSIESKLNVINLDENIVRMEWDDCKVGFHVFTSPLTSGATGVHFFYSARNEAWFPDVYPNDLQPVATKVYDGDSPDDRVVLLGSEDGYIRFFDSATNNDDGVAIESYVWIGPFQVEEGRVPFVLSDLKLCLGDGSDDVGYDVFGFDCAEEVNSAFDCIATEDGLDFELEDGTGCILTEDSEAASSFTSEFSASGMFNHNPRVRARAMYIRLFNSTLGETWNMEWLQAKLQTIPTSRRRRL